MIFVCGWNKKSFIHVVRNLWFLCQFLLPGKSRRISNIWLSFCVRKGNADLELCTKEQHWLLINIFRTIPRRKLLWLSLA